MLEGPGDFSFISPWIASAISSDSITISSISNEAPSIRSQSGGKDFEYSLIRSFVTFWRSSRDGGRGQSCTVINQRRMTFHASLTLPWLLLPKLSENSSNWQPSFCCYLRRQETCHCSEQSNASPGTSDQTWQHWESCHKLYRFLHRYRICVSTTQEDHLRKKLKRIGKWEREGKYCERII